MNNQFGHLMLDLETLGTKSNSVILSIAAVQFSLLTGEIGKTFYTNVSIQSCLDLGLKIDGDTLEWWLVKSEEARKGVLHDPKLPLPSAVQSLWSFIKNLNDEGIQIWGNGARFDLGIINDAFSACKMHLPWKHSNERDVRTLVSFNPDIKANTKFVGTEHNALDDCFHQIKYCHQTYNHLITKVDTNENT